MWICTLNQVERKETEKVADFVRNTFIYLFDTDIAEQLSMEDKWKGRTPPVSITYSSIESEVASLSNASNTTNDPMRVLSVAENAASFMSTMGELVRRKEECGELVFDKDDGVAMEFVSSAANLRMRCYHIDSQSPFVLKGIAGNIIHAIATTNAITAGCMVVQAVHILKRNQSMAECKEEESEQKISGEAAVRALPTRVCWVNSKGRRWLYPQMMETPNSGCFICQKSVVHLTLNPALFDYGSFVKRILQKHLGFKQPDIAIEFVDPTDPEGAKRGSNLLECATEGDDEEERAEKEGLAVLALDDPRIKIYDAASLSIDDFSQDVQVNLVVHYLDLDAEKHPQGFEVTNTWSLSKFTVAAAQSGGGDGSPEESGSVENGHTSGGGNGVTDGLNVGNGVTVTVERVSGRKRKMNDISKDMEDGKTMEIEEPPTKRAKMGK